VLEDSDMRARARTGLPILRTVLGTGMRELIRRDSGAERDAAFHRIHALTDESRGRPVDRCVGPVYKELPAEGLHCISRLADQAALGAIVELLTPVARLTDGLAHVVDIERPEQVTAVAICAQHTAHAAPVGNDLHVGYSTLARFALFMEIESGC